MNKKVIVGIIVVVVIVIAGVVGYNEFSKAQANSRYQELSIKIAEFSILSNEAFQKGDYKESSRFSAEIQKLNDERMKLYVEMKKNKGIELDDSAETKAKIEKMREEANNKKQ